MPDHRDVKAAERKWYESIDEARMTLKVELEGENGDLYKHEISFHWEICGTCQGKGTHVNPSIDSHGLTAEDFAEDPDFAENYLDGTYDQICNECGGKRVVPEPEIIDERLQEQIEEKRIVFREDARTSIIEREMGY